MSNVTESRPQPSKPFATVSVLVIAGSLLFLSFFLGACVVEPDPIAFMGGLFILPICVLMAAQQYRGTFRRVPAAASMTGVTLYLLGGLSTVSFVVLVGEFILAGTSLSFITWVLIPMLIASTAGIAGGRMNALWARQLRAGMGSRVVAPGPVNFSLRELLGAIVIVAIMMAIVSQIIRFAPPRRAQNIAASAAPFGLPPGASNVSYGKGFRGTIAFEFSVEESVFREWVSSRIGSVESQSAGSSIHEITSPFRITRYGTYSSDLGGPNEITIDAGLYYSWSEEDRGVYAAYDRATGRAYYHAHFH